MLMLSHILAKQGNAALRRHGFSLALASRFLPCSD